VEQQRSSINDLRNLVVGGNSRGGLRRRKTSLDAELYPSTSNEKQNSAHLPVFNLGMMMVSRVQQAFTASSPTQPTPSTKSEVQQLQQQLDQLRNQHTELGNQYQQVQSVAVYYQNLHQCGEKQLQEALLRHNDERKAWDKQTQKAAEERVNLEAKCEEETDRKLAVESELKEARHLVECFKGRQRSLSVDSLDTESSFSSELARANEMVEVLRNQLKRSEEELAVRSVTSDDLSVDVNLNQEDRIHSLQELVEKLKSSRRRKIEQITHLCDALNVAGVNCDELRENLMKTRDSNKRNKTKIQQLTQENEQLRLLLVGLQTEIDEKNAEIDNESVAWQQRVDALELEHEETERAMKELHAIEMNEVDAKLKEFAFENTKFVERELHLAEERNSTCDRLREALESLEKLEVACTSTNDENATLRDQLLALELNHKETERVVKELHAIEMTEVDAKLKEIVERELHLVEDRTLTCDRLREALESLEKLEVACTSTNDENVTLRDQLERYEAVRHEESSALRSEIGKCESQLMQNQQTISRLRDRNLQLLDQIDQEKQARELQRAELDECARKSAADEADMKHLRAESRSAILASNAELHELKARVSSLKAELSARENVTKEMNAQLDEQKKYAEWCEERMRWFEGLCSRLHEDASFFHNDARKHFDAACSLQRDNDQWHRWYQQQRHHHYGGRLFENQKSEKLDTILEEMEPTSSDVGKMSTTPLSSPPRTPVPTTGPDFCPGQSSTPLAKPAAPTDPNQQTKRTFYTLKLESASEEKKLSKRERRIANLRKLPIWRRENPDNWNADLSFCEVSDGEDDVISSGASAKSSSYSCC